MTETYQNSVTLVNFFCYLSMVYSTFACISQKIGKRIKGLLKGEKSKLILEWPCYDAVFAVAVKRHFGNHPPFDRHAGRDHTIGAVRYQRMPLR